MKFPELEDYPDTIRIGKTSWKISFSNEVLKDDWAGYCCDESRTIYLAAGMGKKETFVTLVHELLHAMDFDFDIRIPHRVVYGLEEPLALLILSAAFASPPSRPRSQRS